MRAESPAPVVADDLQHPLGLGRWTLLVGTGELIGFLFPAAAGVLWADAAAAVLLVSAAGAVEGVVLGLALWLAMHRDVPELRPGPWIGGTAAAAAFAYLLGFAPSSSAQIWTTWPVAAQVAVGIPLIAALLLSIGTAQWLVLRHVVHHAWWWIIGSALAWLAGLGVFFVVAPPLWQEGQPFALALAIGVFAGAAMAAAMAVVTGMTWRRILALQGGLGGG